VTRIREFFTWLGLKNPIQDKDFPILWPQKSYGSDRPLVELPGASMVQDHLFKTKGSNEPEVVQGWVDKTRKCTSGTKEKSLGSHGIPMSLSNMATFCSWFVVGSRVWW
jgi:hypothetical protein